VGRGVKAGASASSVEQPSARNPRIIFAFDSGKRGLKVPKSLLIRIAAVGLLAGSPGAAVHAQVTIGNPSAQPTTLPLTTQIKKTVVFLEADCLHDFGPDIAQLTPEALAKLSPQQVTALRQQMTTLIMQLQTPQQGMAKLTAEEAAMLRPGPLLALDLPRLAGLVEKMSNLTDGDIEKLTPQEIASLPTDPHMGTGFIVLVPDGGWPTFALPRLRLPHPSRFSKGGYLGRE
jgi:hypothetical protein